MQPYCNNTFIFVKGYCILVFYRILTLLHYQFLHCPNCYSLVLTSLYYIRFISLAIAGLLVMTVGMHFMRNRTAILIGGIIKTMATLIAGLSTDVSVLFFSIGVLDGNINCI